MTFALDWPTEFVSANVSLLYAGSSVLERPRLAAEAGFRAIESWWPFRTAVPERVELECFVESVIAAEMAMASLNFFTGDRSQAERGLPAIHAGAERFRANVPVAIELADRLGCRRLNLLYGNAEPGETFDIGLTRAAPLIAAAADAAAERGIDVMIEPLSALEAPRYAVRTVADVRRVAEAVRELGGASVGICYDVYHLCQSDPDSLSRIPRDIELISHVQIADFPGRGEPGTGDLDIPGIVDSLGLAGYAGYIGLEFLPSGPVSFPHRGAAIPGTTTHND